VIGETAQQKADIVCLPEGITVVGTGKKYAEVAEPIPGPSTKFLGEQAARHRLYIVAGLYERAGKAIYNTSVLIGRDGRLAGKYRKVCLPREEIDGGLTPGQDYPVFDTDFGRIGMMICWDVHFPEVARALAAKGAEVIQWEQMVRYYGWYGATRGYGQRVKPMLPDDLTRLSSTYLCISGNGNV
jgi:predicted amidohydrolase